MQRPLPEGSRSSSPRPEAAIRPSRTPASQKKEIECHEADLLDLEETEYVRVTSRQRGIVFYLTPPGRRRAEQLDLSNAALAGGPVEQHALDWTGGVRPVLEAVGRIYSPGHSPMGIRTEEVAAELGADAHETALC
jgi:hypothetical protein